MVPKIYDKDRKINVFCLPCVNCGISSHLDEFWDGFCCAFLLAASHHYIKIEKEDNFVRLLDTVAHRKRPNSPISTHRTATIFTQLTLKIFDHVPCRKLSWSNAYYCLICTFENYSRTDFGFRHRIPTDMREHFGHVTSQILPRYHTQGKFWKFNKNWANQRTR